MQGGPCNSPQIKGGFTRARVPSRKRRCDSDHSSGAISKGPPVLASRDHPSKGPNARAMDEPFKECLLANVGLVSAVAGQGPMATVMSMGLGNTVNYALYRVITCPGEVGVSSAHTSLQARDWVKCQTRPSYPAFPSCRRRYKRTLSQRWR